MSLASSATEILEPYIGHTVADTCVRATALSLGKSSDTLTAEDLPQLTANIRRLLQPVAPAAAIEQLLIEIERSAA